RAAVTSVPDCGEGSRHETRKIDLRDPKQYGALWRTHLGRLNPILRVTSERLKLPRCEAGPCAAFMVLTVERRKARQTALISMDSIHMRSRRRFSAVLESRGGGEILGLTPEGAP